MASNQPSHQVYTQWCEDFRALQTVFWQVPFFAMTITGGLGAAVLAFDGATEVKRLLLFFAGICNFVLILIAWRVRKTMEALLVKIFLYEGVAKSKSGFFVLKCFTALFAMVACILIVAAIFAPTSWLSRDAGNSSKKDGIYNTINAPGSNLKVN
jgi:hypothetical protein